MKRMTVFALVLFFSFSAPLIFAQTTHRLAGEEDLNRGSGTFTDSSGMPLHQINMNSFPFTQDNAIKGGNTNLYNMSLGVVAPWRMFYTDANGEVAYITLDDGNKCIRGGNPPVLGECGGGSSGMTVPSSVVEDDVVTWGTDNTTLKSSGKKINQDLRTTDDVTFNSVSTSGADGTRGVTIPNTSAPTGADLWANKCWLDITTDTYDCRNQDNTATYKYAARIKDKSFVVKSPADADDFLLFKAVRAINIAQLDCIVDPADTGDSISVDLQECDGTGDSCASGGISVTADNDGAVDTSFTDADVDAGDWVRVVLGAPSGTVTFLTCTVRYRE